MVQNEEIAAKFLSDSEFQQTVTSYLRQRVYDQIRGEAGEDTSA